MNSETTAELTRLVYAGAVCPDQEYIYIDGDPLQTHNIEACTKAIVTLLPNLRRVGYGTSPGYNKYSCSTELHNKLEAVTYILTKHCAEMIRR
jgi:hypothetical protein